MGSEVTLTYGIVAKVATSGAVSGKMDPVIWITVTFFNMQCVCYLAHLICSAGVTTYMYVCMTSCNY